MELDAQQYHAKFTRLLELERTASKDDASFKRCVDALDTLVADKASDGVKLMALPTTASGHMWPQIDVTSSLG